ncbi:MAG: cation-translocating P-type ATPase [Methylotenera sp.]|uniref:cation-translocating P-type ATPase n=1 Tax=Methylotenera sp. TaxID=2051956 RepID=UPI00273010A4|nr:cation-translocating P-type ATPase [Methylotenera sp.]MDP1522943.1 cation-translocating P-type ATPase [Methylotenera sp.]
MKTILADIKNQSGLSQAEATLRLKSEGVNELPASGKRDLLRIALEVVREPMLLLLVAAGAIYLVLGDVGDALMLLGFVFVVMAITIYQENKTERVLEALRDLTSPRALVIRDGLEQRIAGCEVVRGDVLILTEGDRVPADAVLVSCHHFAADESLLTGESVAVRKIAQPESEMMDNSDIRPPGGDGLPFVYSGSLVVQGRGMAYVLATGARTEIGKIGKALQNLDTETTPLQQEIRKLVRNLAILGTLLSLLLLVIYGLTRGDWLNGLLSSITLAMSILPEEYPVVLTVFMAMGAWRISKHRVLTRRVYTIEALGSATVMCVDKTGTLTFNRMAVQQLVANNLTFTVAKSNESKGESEYDSLPETFHEVLEFGILASESSPFDAAPLDPMEKAIQELGQKYLTNTEHLHGDWKLAHEYSLSPELLALSHVWKALDRDEYVVAAKGAPEAIADLCHLNQQQLETLSKQVNDLAEQGMRVLGVAKASYSGSVWPDIQHDFDFEFLGLIGLADSVRPNVAPALKECNAAGIRVVMITGDYPATAAAIAAEIGLDIGKGGIISGTELSQMDELTLRERIRHSNIFARMVPEQKLRLVNALKANGEIVAMTGDGVNDAPALKAAHIGIAMGGRGTDVAREASALVLLDDDFASIVHAVHLGRSIFDNLRKGMAYIFAVHFPIIGLSLVPLLLGWPPMFAPVHIVFLEMIINPACSIAFEAEPADSNVMQRPPRPPKESLFGQNVFMISLLQGAFLLLMSLVVMGYALHNGFTEEATRALTFTTLVTGNLGLILVNRSWRHSVLRTLNIRNPALWWVIAGALAFLSLALTVPLLNEIFHFAPITIQQFGFCVLVGLSSVIWFELYKIFRRSA